MISRSERAIEDGGNSMATETLSFSDVQNRDSSKASGISLGINVGRNQSGNMFSLGMAPGMGKVSESQGGTTRGGISVAAVTVGDKQALARLPERARQHLALAKSRVPRSTATATASGKRRSPNDGRARGGAAPDSGGA